MSSNYDLTILDKYRALIRYALENEFISSINPTLTPEEFLKMMFEKRALAKVSMNHMLFLIMWSNLEKMMFELEALIAERAFLLSPDNTDNHDQEK